MNPLVPESLLAPPAARARGSSRRSLETQVVSGGTFVYTKLMEPAFRWNADNIEHIGAHDVLPQEAEHVVRQVRPPFPRAIGGGKHLVWGQTADGTYLQVIFIYSPPGVIYVIHARPLNDQEKNRLRRRRR